MSHGDQTASAPPGGASSQVPLCVDLDGTLVRSDTLLETLIQYLRANPLRILGVPVWLARGRARLKREIAERTELDAARLPYNPELLAHLRGERQTGRRLVLVTASHVLPARAVADHLELFDEVLATDGQLNLKGPNKCRELVQRFGEHGFDYAGDSQADLSVWPSAREAILVNAPAAVRRRMGDRASRVFDPRRLSMLKMIVKVMRVRQWVKNLLLFLPILLAHRYTEPALVGRVALGFLAFSLGASAVYVLNDLLDVEADRHHPVKRRRPFASGELPLQAGFFLVPLLAAASIGISLWLPGSFLLVLGAYFAMTTLYSVLLKEIALLDILVLAALFTTRIIAGSAASGVVVSEWLLAFSMFIFLSLAAVKRYAELLRVRGENSGDVKIKRRGYFAGDFELIVQMGIASGYMAVLVLALYITSDTVATLYAHPRLLWLACPLLLFWISRIWLLAHRGEVQDDPLNFAVKDGTTWLVALLSGVVIVAASRWPA